MNKFIALSLTASAVMLGSNLISLSASAADTIPGHPRVNQVEKRIDNQENNVEKLEQSGKITEQQADRDEKRLENQKDTLVKDEAEHNGHITKAEQKNLNHKLNKNNKIDAKQKHHDKKVEEKKDETTTPVTN
jgi:hypothetical protein